jgi:hypothetical protein
MALAIRRASAARVILPRAISARCDGAGRMNDFVTDLKKTFDATMFDRLESYWVLPDGKSFERSDEDENAIEIFEILVATVDVIPSSLIRAEELRASRPRSGVFRLALQSGALSQRPLQSDAIIDITASTMITAP